ncbi:MAG: M81 family metallopeptidase [Chloroflexota bacterium]
MQRLRVAVGGISHETNTFAIHPTTYDTFLASGILRGAAMVEQHRTALSTLAGFLELADDPDVDLVPLMWANTNPSGTITTDAFERLMAELLDLLRANGPWDAVFLALHGAAVADGIPETDGEIVARVRALVGPAVPIGVALDMHANVGPLVVAQSDVVTIYRTNPHVDPRARAAECGRLIVDQVRGKVRPTQALVQVPAAIGILQQNTAEEPMRSLMADADRLLAVPGVLSYSVAEGYPYADVPQMGMAALVITDGDPAAAQRLAAGLAADIWARRAGFIGRAATPDDALREADAAVAGGSGPIALMDVGDNIGGGSPGDGTILLEAAQRLGIRGFLAILRDPDAVAACVASGVGARVTLDVGGHVDPRNGAPVHVDGRVRAITDGRYEDPTPTHGGFRFFDAGTTVVLHTDDDHTLLLTTRIVMPSSLEQLRSAGVQPERLRILSAKGVVSPRAAYDRVAARTILVDTSGVTAADPMGFDHHHRRTPLFPWETDIDFRPEG